METTTITMIAILVVIALLLVWLSLSMAATEGAVGRVTRASLNNLILEIQTDTEASQFIRDKKIKRIHKVQRLIADRYATAGSCAFFRITCNVLDGVLVAAIASLCDAPLWAGLLVGFVFALVVAVISLLVRPRSAGASKPVDLMLKHADAASVAVALTPFAKIGGQKDAKRHSNDLSDDEELEKIQLEQGRATIDRLVEANDFDPEVSEMLRNVLTLSETLTREIMVPRTDMICIERGETLENMLKLCSRSGFSRIPVIGDDVDDLVGVAYLKDAVRATAFNPAAISRDVESIVRDPMLVPESKPVDDLFHQMQRTRQHVAIVVDEYGGIAGLVTIEDTIEQIVGELEGQIFSCGDIVSPFVACLISAGRQSCGRLRLSRFDLAERNLLCDVRVGVVGDNNPVGDADVLCAQNGGAVSSVHNAVGDTSALDGLPAGANFLGGEVVGLHCFPFRLVLSTYKYRHLQSRVKQFPETFPTRLPRLVPLYRSRARCCPPASIRHARSRRAPGAHRR